MAKFQITNLHTGADYGVFEGTDKAEAVAAMQREAGYRVEAKDGELVFPDDETAKLCGDIGEAWAADEIEA